jgi:glycosyltransferase involved in cell wall biosynthesis
VVIAAHNAAAYVREALTALSGAEESPYEVILVDDASTDGTAEVALSVPMNVDMRVHRLHLNKGSAAARNVAISQAKGEFIAVADADDVTLPRRLDKQLAFLVDQPRIDVVGGQLLGFGPWGGPVRTWAYPTDPQEIQATFDRGRMGLAHPTTMYRRAWFESVGGYDPRLRRCQDFDLFLRGRRGANYAALPDHLIHYRRPRRQVSWAYWWENERYRRSIVQMHRGGGDPSVADFATMLRKNSRAKAWVKEGLS